MVQSLKTNCLNGQTEVGIFKWQLYSIYTLWQRI
jgi:hypothetical protein